MIVKMKFSNALKQKFYSTIYEFSECKKYRLEFHKWFKLLVRAAPRIPDNAKSMKVIRPNSMLTYCRTATKCWVFII